MIKDSSGGRGASEQPEPIPRERSRATKKEAVEEVAAERAKGKEQGPTEKGKSSAREAKRRGSSRPPPVRVQRGSSVQNTANRPTQGVRPGRVAERWRPKDKYDRGAGAAPPAPCATLRATRGLTHPKGSAHQAAATRGSGQYGKRTRQGRATAQRVGRWWEEPGKTGPTSGRRAGE